MYCNESYVMVGSHTKYSFPVLTLLVMGDVPRLRDEMK